MAALVICITIHEFAHAYAAYRAGDDTPRLQGRISLNPLDHLDPMGTIMMIVTSLTGFGIGWGKPVMVNPANFRHPRWDNLRVSLWGPLSNLLTSAVTGALLRFLHPGVLSTNVGMFLMMITLTGIGLAVFNLIPLGPLDGAHIVSALLPREAARSFDYFMARHGTIVFLALVLLGGSVLDKIIGPVAFFFWHAFTGF